MAIRNNLTSVNYTPGRAIYINGKLTHVGVSGITLHTEQGYENGTISWFKNPASQVSANYGVALDGNVDLIVAEGDTSWADGNFESNSRHITIECEDNNDPNGVVRTDAQYESLGRLVADIARRYGFAVNRATVKGHNEIPPHSHPQCPGNLNVDHVVTLANLYLSETNIPKPAPSPDVLREYHDWTGRVTVTNAVLQCRTAPSTHADGNQANTSDGVLHAGMICDVVGWGIGEDPYNDGRNKWFKSWRGKWFWAPGTDHPNPIYGAAPQLQETPPVVSTPVVEVAPAPVVETAPAPEVDPVPVTKSYTNTIPFEEGPVHVITELGSTVVDMTTGKAVATVPAGRDLTVVGYVQHNDTYYLQTENLASTMPTHGLPSSDWHDYVAPAAPQVDAIQPATPAAAPKPTLEDTLRNTKSPWLKMLLRFFHLTHK